MLNHVKSWQIMQVMPLIYEVGILLTLQKH